MERFDHSERGRIILTELIKMAIGLGIDTVAKGVATEEQVSFLKEIGCTKLQGNYYCKPITSDQILERYEKGIQIGFENPAESDYYASLGRINLYDMTVIANKDMESFDNYFNTVPMAIMETKSDKMKITRCNSSYRDFMERSFGVMMVGVEVSADSFKSGVGQYQSVHGIQCFKGLRGPRAYQGG